MARSHRRGPINATVYCDARDRARKLGLSPEQHVSPLGEDPYDLRHAAVSKFRCSAPEFRHAAFGRKITMHLNC